MQVAIQVSELRFSTEEGVLILDDLSFGVPREGFVFVVGPPSSGKTLLLKLILRELPPSGGQILLVGRNVARLSPKKVAQLRRRVGYVPERPPLLEDRTVQGNLLFKLRALGYKGEELEEELSRALELTGLSALADEPAGELPPLERALLALALALLAGVLVSNSREEAVSTWHLIYRKLQSEDPGDFGVLAEIEKVAAVSEVESLLKR